MPADTHPTLLAQLALLVPLLGVVLGWVLSQVTSGWTVSREDRRLRRSSLPPMMELYFQQYRIDQILKFFNFRLGDSLEAMHRALERGNAPIEERKEFLRRLLGHFERTRQMNLDLPSKNKESMFKSLEDAAKELAKVDPVSAYRLSRLANEFVLLIEIKFPDDNLSPKDYIETWGGLLSTYRNDILNLRRLILWTALRVGPIEYLRVLLLLRKEEADSSEPPAELLENVINVVKAKPGGRSSSGSATFGSGSGTRPEKRAPEDSRA